MNAFDNRVAIDRGVVRKFREVTPYNTVIEKDICITEGNRLYAIDSLESIQYHVTVYRARYLYRPFHDHIQIDPDGICRVVLKVFRKAQLEELRIRNVDPLKEVHILQNLRPHPNISTFVDCFHNLDYLFIVLPYGGTPLFEVVKNSRGISENASRDFFIQLSRGLSFLHQYNVAHGSISLKNVIVQQIVGNCKIIDFSDSIIISRDNQGHPIKVSKYLPLSYTHTAPEIISDDIYFYDAIKADIWSLGILLFVMITGYYPFRYSTHSDQAYCQVINQNLRRIVDNLGIHISNEVIDLLQRILQYNPDIRISLSEILGHVWTTTEPVLTTLL